MNVLVMCAVMGGTGGAILGGCFIHDWFEGRKLYRAYKGNTREETLKHVRAQVQVLRQEYAAKPGDRFAVELTEMLNHLEETMDRVEAEA